MVLAQQPAAEVASPRFAINRYELSGNTLIPAQDLERLVAPYTGPGKDFGDVQRALDTVEQAYRSRGYGAVRVLLPEQDITQGVVRFQVVEPRVGRVIIEGNNFFDADNIRHSLPSIKEGQTPNSEAMSRNLQVLSEHPTKQTSLTLRPGATEDQVDVGVKITDEKPLRYFFTLDNTGTGETGYFRSGIGFQHSNLHNKDHVLTGQYVTSPTQIDDVTIVGVGYRIPFYQWNSSLDLIAGYSNVDSGTLQSLGGTLNVAGSGLIGAIRWNYYLPKWGQLEQKVSFGLDYRAFRNDVTNPDGSQAIPDVTIHPASVTYSGLRRFADSELSFYGGVAANIPGGNDGDGAAFNASRAGANPNYMIFRAGGNYVQSLPGDWQLRAAANLQYTRDALVSGEQFGIGGPDSVRGYLVRELAGDRGWQTQLEAYTPDVATLVGMPDAYRMRLLAFYDYGSVERNNALAGEVTSAYIHSVGLGMRMNYRKLVSLRLDLAQIMHATLNRQSDSQRLTGALAIVF